MTSPRNHNPAPPTTTIPVGSYEESGFMHDMGLLPCAVTCARESSNTKYDIAVLSFSVGSNLGPKTTYGFQTALNQALAPWRQDFQVGGQNVYFGDNTFLLVNEGCGTGQQRNCTAACTDPKVGAGLMWSNEDFGATLHNCMVFPWLAALLSAGRLSNEAIETASSFNIPNSTELLTEDRWPVINQCTIAYCEEAGSAPKDCAITPQMTVQAEYGEYPPSEPAFGREFWTLVSSNAIVGRRRLILNLLGHRVSTPHCVMTQI